jgi:outer membrane biosynthesis protein TonB
MVWQSESPQDLVNVLPVSPPTADRELQSEAAAGPAVVDEQNQDTQTPVESPPMAPITPPEVVPAPSAQVEAQRQPQASRPRSEPPRAQSQTQPPAAQPRSTQPEQTQRSQSPAAASAEDTAVASAASQSAAAARPVTIGFDKDTYVTSEDDGTVRLVVRRSGSTRREVSFTWILRANSAEAGADYAGIGPGTEKIRAGAREASVTIPLVQDGIKESTELFLIELQAGEGASLGERSSAAIIIVDDD